MMAIDSRWTYAGAAVVVAGVVFTAVFYMMQSEPEPKAPSVAAQVPQEPARFGPGLFPAAKVELPPPTDPAAVDSWAPAGMEITPDQHLVRNKEMRLVFDYFLQPTNPGDRSERLKKLQTHLKATLPAPAYEEAQPLTLSYANYLDALDARKANGQDPAQPGSLPTDYSEIEKLKAGMAEVSRLRQTMLGVEIARLWFGEEEQGLQQLLARRGQLPKVLISEFEKK
jgi:lipase chaperone LimK